MNKEKNSNVNPTPSPLLLLEYSSIEDGNAMNKRFFESLFGCVEFVDFCFISDVLYSYVFT